MAFVRGEAASFVTVWTGASVVGDDIAAEIDLVAHRFHAMMEEFAWWPGTAMVMVIATLWLPRDRHVESAWPPPDPAAA